MPTTSIFLNDDDDDEFSSQSCETMEFFVGRRANVSQRQGVRIKTGQDVE